MIKITNPPSINKIKLCNDIKVGTIFIGKIGAHDIDLYIKYVDGIMSLSNTRNTWTGSPNLEVKDYTEVNISIKIE